MPSPLILKRVKFLKVVIHFINYCSEAFKILFESCQYLIHWVYDQNFYWGAGVVGGEGVTDSERCLKWGGGGGRSLRNLSKNILK